MRRVKGKSLEPILPFLMLDCMFQIYNKEIKPVQCRHEMKHLRKVWMRNYTTLNNQFFRAFNVAQRDEVIDKMDDFENYIQNDLMIAKVAVMNELSDLDFKDANICASCMLCNIFAQSAQIVWSKVYATRSGRNSENPYISGIEASCKRFMDLYHSTVSTRNVNPNNSKQIVTSVDILCHKMIKWLTTN